MRLTVFAGHATPKWAIYEVLDAYHGQVGLQVVSLVDNPGGAMAIDWAKSRPGVELVVANAVQAIRSSDAKNMGRFFSVRAGVIALFKTYQPNVVAVFGRSEWIARGTGKLVMQSALKYNVPVELFEPPYVRGSVTSRTVELCGATSPIRRNICTRVKGHPSAWHWSVSRGERRSKFWLPL